MLIKSLITAKLYAECKNGLVEISVVNTKKKKSAKYIAKSREQVELISSEFSEKATKEFSIDVQKSLNEIFDKVSN